ncbi:MAG: hypothetical protein AAB835_01775 [Patescibacteria group bacterium]
MSSLEQLPLVVFVCVVEVTFAHLAGSGIPKSVLDCVPAPDIHIFACDPTFAHACFNDSMRDCSASALTHDRSPWLFHTCSLCPDGTGYGVGVGGMSDALHPYAGTAEHA